MIGMRWLYIIKRVLGKPSAAILAAALLALAGCGGPETRVVTIPLEIVASDGCRTDARSMRVLHRLPTSDDAGHTWIEAEHADDLVQWPTARIKGVRAVADTEASGGRAVQGVSTARYTLHSPSTRAVSIWLRIRETGDPARLADKRSSLRHAAVLNGKALPLLNDRAEDEGGGSPWSWRKIGVGRLMKGENRLELVRSSRAMMQTDALGPRVDVLLLVPEGQPRPEMPTGAFPTIANRLGAAATLPVDPPGLIAWERVTFDDIGSGLRDRPYIYYATDDEPETWRDLDQDTGYPLDTIDPDDGPLRFRVEMDVPFETPRPVASIRNLAVRARVDTSKWIELTGNDLRLVIDGDSGGLVLMQNTRSGEVVCMPARPEPLGAIAFKKRGEARWLRVDARGDLVMTPEDLKPGSRWPLVPGRFRENPTRPTVRRNGDRLEIEYRFVREGLGEALMMIVIEPRDDGAWRFAQRVENVRGPADVVHSVFPILPRVRLGGSGLDDFMVRPSGWFSQTMRPGREPLPNVAYLGRVVMPWIDISDDRTGLYVGSNDPSATNTLFRSVSGGDAGETVYLETEKRQDIKPGQALTWEYRLGAHTSDWHWGADRYRAWFHEQWGRCLLPERVKRMDGWLAWMAMNSPRGAFRFDDLPRGLTRARAAGLDWVQVWGQFAFDWGPCCQAVYPPSPTFGGAEAWARACREIVRRGGYVGGYFTYRMFDITHLVSDYVAGHFKKSDYPPGMSLPSADLFRDVRLIDDPAGTIPPFPPPQEEIDEHLAKIEKHLDAYRANEHKGVKTPQWKKRVWVGDPDWIEHLRSRVVDTYQREYGNNACYLDVLGTGSAAESYDPRRNHNGDGGYSRGKYELAKRVISAAWTTDRQYAPSMEGLGDLPGVYCAGMSSGLYWGDARRLVRYTLPDHVVIDGMLNVAGRTPYRSMTGAWLEGSALSLMNRPTAIDVALLNLRRHFDAWLDAAEVRDTVGLDISHGQVHGRLFRFEFGGYRGMIVNLLNRHRIDDAKVVVTQPLRGGPVRGAFAVSLDGEVTKLDLRSTASAVGFDAPDAAASAVYLVQDASAIWPLLRLDLSEAPAVVATVLNPTDGRRKGTLRLTDIALPEPYDNNNAAAAALPLATAELEYDVEPGGIQVLRYPLDGYPANAYSVYVTAEAGVRKRRVSRRVLLTPTVLDGSFEFEGADSENATAGRRIFAQDVTKKQRAVPAPSLWLLPERRYRLSFSVRAAKPGRRRGVVKLYMSYDGRKKREVSVPFALKKHGAWTRVEHEFVTPERLESARMQIYADKKWGEVWFDDVRVVDLGRRAE